MRASHDVCVRFAFDVRQFFNVWRRTFRASMVVLTSIFLLTILFYFFIVVPRDYEFVSTFFGDRVALGAQLAYANMLTPLLDEPRRCCQSS